MVSEKWFDARTEEPNRTRWSSSSVIVLGPSSISTRSIVCGYTVSNCGESMTNFARPLPKS